MDRGASLNGAHGEVTGSDDFDAASRVRARKEAKTNRHRRTPGSSSGKTKNSQVFSEVEVEEPKMEPVVEEPPFLWGDPDLSFDGEKFSRTPGTSFYGEFDCVTKTVGPGRHPFRQHATLPKFTAFGMTFEPSQVIVLLPVQMLLDRDFPVMSQVQRNFANILRYIKVKIPFLTLAEHQAHARFYAYQLSLVPGAPMVGEFVVPEFKDDATYDFGAQFVIPPTECSVELAYDFNRRWRCSDRKNFNFRFMVLKLQRTPALSHNPVNHHF
jgi:hypothetical protein